MSFAYKSFRGRKAIPQKCDVPYVPMGDERFRQLMNDMSLAFAQADDGEHKRKQTRERERQHEQWLIQRKVVIAEIVATMQQLGLSANDLV